MDPRRPPLCVALIAALLLAPAAALADRVAPSERVRSRVVVREKASARSRDVGSLRPGETAAHLATEAGWRRVELADGTVGYVSESWTVLVADAGEQARRFETSRLSFFERLKQRFGEAPPTVEFALREPGPGRAVYRNTDPTLPVSGFARPEGGGLRYDVVLALDLSTSTNEHAGADVDGDGRADDGWRSADSIFAAQIAAVRQLLHTLGRMPGNHDGERIRVALVTYAGDERFRSDAGDADLELSAEEIFRLAARDAELRVGLTSDYAAVERALRALSRVEPVGMTDAAAGVARAILELGLSPAPPPDGAPGRSQRVILFLTDGKPSLPFGPDQAERAAAFAGKIAAQAGIRINLFALGRDAVRRDRNGALERMSRRTGGAYVELANPAEIVQALESTPFSLVEDVRLSNLTTGVRSEAIATGIDGSFYGEIPLAEGVNRIEVAARADDGREARESFEIEYVKGQPAEELAAQLKRIRIENEALIERIKENLAAEMVKARKRTRQERSLQIEVEELPAHAD